MLKYVVYYNSQILFDSTNPSEFPISSGKLSLEVNTAGTLNLSIPVSNPLTSSLRKMGPSITLVSSWIDDNGNVVDTYIPFHGRIVTIEHDIYGNVTIDCEGSYSFLKDAICNPFMIMDIDDHDTVITSFIQTLSNLHRGQVEKQPIGESFGRGVYHFQTRTDKVVDNDALYRQIKNVDYSDNTKDYYYGFKTIFDFIKEYVVDYDGGFIYMENQPDTSVVNGFRSLAWYFSFASKYEGSSDGMEYAHCLLYDGQASESSSTNIVPLFSFGENVLDYTNAYPVEEIFTGIFARSADGRLTIDNPDGLAHFGMDTKYKWGNDELIRRFGYIPKEIVFNDISLSDEDYSRSSYVAGMCQELNNAADKWLNTHLCVFPDKYTIKGPEPIVQEGFGSRLIRLMHGVRFRDSYKNISITLPCLAMELNLMNYTDNQYTIGPFIPDNYLESNITR